MREMPAEVETYTHRWILKKSHKVQVWMPVREWEERKASNIKKFQGLAARAGGLSAAMKPSVKPSLPGGGRAHLLGAAAAAAPLVPQPPSEPRAGQGEGCWLVEEVVEEVVNGAVELVLGAAAAVAEAAAEAAAEAVIGALEQAACAAAAPPPAEAAETTPPPPPPPSEAAVAALLAESDWPDGADRGAGMAPEDEDRPVVGALLVAATLPPLTEGGAQIFGRCRRSASSRSGLAHGRPPEKGWVVDPS